MIEQREITDEQTLTPSSTMGEMLNMIAALDQASKVMPPESPEEKNIKLG